MVLVDTSVWIHFLAGRAPFAAGLDALLERDEVLAHDLVFGELLIGDRGGRRVMLASYEKILRELHGRGVGWVDVHLLASTLVARTVLWTADPRLADLADELHVAYVGRA
jgi:predicted nucleic acid-binding protein